MSMQIKAYSNLLDVFLVIGLFGVRTAYYNI